MSKPPAESDTHVATLSNGVRVIVAQLPARQTVDVSVFVRSGSMHERRALNGIGHVVEHMVFKGTRTRDAHRINLDAECLGAEVNAHTDKDHSAFHMQGLARDSERLLAMLAELVQQPSFPAEELERERQVLLQEFVEDEDDPMSTAYKLFDLACYGLHPVAQPAIGRRANIERFTRADLVQWVERQYTGANLVVAAAGPLVPDAFVRAVQASFGRVPTGVPNVVAAPAWAGGLRTRRVGGSSQTHLVLGFPIAPLGAADASGEVAAAVFGEGMSAPLMAELRERRGLVYFAACAADVLDVCAEFVVEASFAPDKLDPVLQALVSLLRAKAERVDLVDLARARNQLAVRLLRAQEKPERRLEAAALDLFALGRVRGAAERLAGIEGVSANRIRKTFGTMMDAGVAAALTGSLGRAAGERARADLAPLAAAPLRRSSPAADSAAGSAA